MRNIKYRAQDFKNFIISLKYNFGISKEKPKFGKYNLSTKISILGCYFWFFTNDINGHGTFY